MVLRKFVLPSAALVSAMFFFCEFSFAATSYSDRLGDVQGGAGPDLAAVTVANTKTMVTFRIRFSKAPPLRFSAAKGWVDMLLIGVDVPPIGPRPQIPGGPWLGANFALGTHGPSKTGLMVKLGKGIPQQSRQVATFKIMTTRSILTFSIPRRALGNPSAFTFTVAAARELQNEATGGGIDLAPANGTFHYALAR